MAKDESIENARLEKMRDDLGEKYYENLEKMIGKYDIFLHDIKHTMRTIEALAEEGNCEEISSLIRRQQDILGRISRDVMCSHKILNALLVERRAYAENLGLVFDIVVEEPLYLDEIDDLDLIVLVGNLVDNAIEGEKQSKKREGIVCDIRTSKEGKHTLIQIENSFDGKSSNKNRTSGRNEAIGEKHGIGLRSVKRIVRKYGGIIDSDKKGGKYLVNILLPIESKWKK